MTRTAVVVFNLGGPDCPEAVRPFLFNLFNDPEILRLPAPFRWVLARYITARRTPVAREIYDRIGGRSPILEMTREQAAGLQAILGDPADIRVFVAMRYWHPFSEECIAEIAAYGADRVILLPLYPQFSTTTTGSFIRAWRAAAAKAELAADTTTICCYPDENGFIAALAGLTSAGIQEAASHGKPRVLFSAHGLPEKIVAAGDPYPRQVARTVEAVVRALAIDGLDYVVCYQSRVGRTKWLEPYTDDEIVRAGAEGVPVVVVPVAFVSEHSETLVELDMDYAKLAGEKGVPAYVRTPTVSAAETFIAGLARLVRQALAGDGAILSGGGGGRVCPAAMAGCPLPVKGPGG